MVALAIAFAERERALAHTEPDVAFVRECEITILEVTPADLPDVVAVLHLVGELITDQPGADLHVLALARVAAFINTIAPFGVGGQS